MEISINWNDINFNQTLNNQIQSYLDNLKKKEYFKNANVNIFTRTNARHIIEVAIDTKNPDEQLKTCGISCNFDSSLFDLKNKLNYLVNKYNPNHYQQMIDLKKRKEQQAELKIRKEQAKNEKIKQQKLAKIEQENKLKEQNRLKKIKQDQKRIAELSAKKQKTEEELEKQINLELKKRQEEVEKEKLLANEKIAKAIDLINHSNENISNDIGDSQKTQIEIKQKKDELYDLYAQENEALVIIAKMDEWRSKVFNDKFYPPNQPFEIIADHPFYHDGENHYFHLNANNEWEPCDFSEVEQAFEILKQQKLEKLECDLIQARARTPKHLLDLADNRKVIEELNKSKTKLKEISKQRKKDIKELKKDNDEFEKKINDKLEIKNGETLSNLDFLETHNPNEPFLTEDGLYYAYHNGEGNYYAYMNEQWTPVSKEFVYQNSLGSKSTNNQNETHNVNEAFLNKDGIYFYFDENKNYYKCINNEWVLSSYDECYASSSNEANENINYQQEATTSSGAQQWQDENGYWWYLDEQGNYFYADENGNWVPYQ